MADSRPDDGGSVSATADRTPLPGGGRGAVEPRFVDVWRAFLGELATDAHKAHAAAIAYRELDADARDSWITVLEHDCGQVDAPKIAVYAPLLAVETDGVRRRRIIDAIGPVDRASVPMVTPRALVGQTTRGQRVAVLVVPLYLRFVQVLACGLRAGDGFEWVRHDPIVEEPEAPGPGADVAGAALELVPLNTLVDELSLAVVAHVRSGRVLPDALRLYADLFGPVLPSTAGD